MKQFIETQLSKLVSLFDFHYYLMTILKTVCFSWHITSNWFFLEINDKIKIKKSFTNSFECLSAESS